jgi:quercetin dioxygenase-like cupin family protein
MTEFPAFMKQPANRIATASQATPGVEGYVFDGADGSQMAFWTCRETAISAPHSHDFDDMLVVEGRYTLIIHGKKGDEKKIPLEAGQEYFLPRGVVHGGEVIAGTRTIHAFGGHRANRISATQTPSHAKSVK